MSAYVAFSRVLVQISMASLFETELQYVRFKSRECQASLMVHIKEFSEVRRHLQNSMTGWVWVNAVRKGSSEDWDSNQRQIHRGCTGVCEREKGEGSIRERSTVRIEALESREMWKPDPELGGRGWGSGVYMENKLERLAEAILPKTHDSGLDPLGLWKLIQRDKGSCGNALIRLQETEHSKDSPFHGQPSSPKCPANFKLRNMTKVSLYVMHRSYKTK